MSNPKHVEYSKSPKPKYATYNIKQTLKQKDSFFCQALDL